MGEQYIFSIIPLDYILLDEIFSIKDKDFDLHQTILYGTTGNKKIYTPRGVGHRKFVRNQKFWSS